ncbi:EAL domain-containing protein [Oscillatoriales cyanobacterium LEGE 11467]|uniref:EAL domain-containing protein n=1 Tax=Zarconia navalis LEGE 11467 TaxID=1828826 RepID=A0A928VXM1_9CYAN|nr:EAL domain-containing protein [Zarconia navalis]MBE9041489.1 EAL domain-containing protein [Zarconia navalis LEGE 11467]
MSFSIDWLHRQLCSVVSAITTTWGTSGRRKHPKRINWRHPVGAISLGVPPVLLVISQLGGFQALELAAFDILMEGRGEGFLDSRLSMVEITQADINEYRWPLSDRLLARILERLQEAHPQVIGLDLDRPQGSLEPSLVLQLKAENVIVTQTAKVSSVVPRSRLGFNNIPTDPDNVVRRNWLVTPSDREEPNYSFSLRLALAYLQNREISLKFLSNPVEKLQLGKAILSPLKSSSGGYRHLDLDGTQILLNYRSPHSIAPRIGLGQVLRGEFEPSSIRGKIVLIGSTVPSLKERFNTPYNSRNDRDSQMPGVFLHAQMTAQLLDAALGKPVLFRFVPDLMEGLWLFGWAGLGGVMAWNIKHPGKLAGAIVLGLFGLCAISWGLFALNVWMPSILPVVGFLVTISSVAIYKFLYNAFYDSLTGLPNRVLFANHLRLASKRVSLTPEERLGVIFLDVDRFKAINGCLGHKAGDRLLKEMGVRISRCLRCADRVSRVGGDEFAILVDRIKDLKDVTRIARRIRKQLKRPFYLSGQSVFTSASMGIAMSNGSHRDLLRDAHTAMYRAKRLGQTHPEVFDPIMESQAIAQFELELDLRKSMAHTFLFEASDRDTRQWLEEENSHLPHSQFGEEFHVYYQPLVSLQSGKIAGFEALVRWQHPERGFVSPEEFIPVAERTGLILPLGMWILREACRQTRLWKTQFGQNAPSIVSVNLSGKQFVQPDLVAQIDRILQQTHLDPRSLKLEITEGVVMENVDRTIDTLRNMKALKIKLGIDDFGTGYSSFSYLSQFPTDTLKIDRTFISCMEERPENRAIVQTIVMLAHTLGMDAIVEGVETREQWQQLREIGCEYGQGYFFSKPLSSREATALLASKPRWSPHLDSYRHHMGEPEIAIGDQ